MKRILLPPRSMWEPLCMRPEAESADLDDTVKSIVRSIRERGDSAVRDMSTAFDGYVTESLKVIPEEITMAAQLVPENLRDALEKAKINIETFHSTQLTAEQAVDISAGVRCWRRNVPIESVGLYIPGGNAPLFSTVLMLAIPAIIAGCKKIVMCTPPDRNGNINPAILYAALITGITDIYKIGGAQAIAAMAYGTESVPRVYKIFGPGNRYVTRAKELVQQDGIAIDMPAGPSELMIIADARANPEFVAADLLSQAEHGPDSQVTLLTDNEMLLKNIMAEVKKQQHKLPRKEIIERSLENSLFILLHSPDECIDFSNAYAPEHLIIATANTSVLAERVINAGSVFLGEYSCESAGDYASGTNHTLPTNRYARNYSGLSVESFVRKITFQEITEEGIRELGPVIQTMASAEGLEGHKNAVTVRLNKLSNDRPK
ncbi:MAG TPA: histidinol dehydrogenase [Bacteroidales bacterium]|nr:histidinol dehydrogenase [Bacteroidales bacterium]